MDFLVRILPRLLPRNPRTCKILQDRAKKFKKSQDSYQEVQEKTKNRQENARFLFRTSVIIKPSEVSANELRNYSKIYSIIKLRSENDKFQTQI